MIVTVQERANNGLDGLIEVALEEVDTSEMESTQFADGVYTGVKEGVEKDSNICNLCNWMNADAMC